MKKNAKKILFLPVIICILFSSLSLYSCVNQNDEEVIKWHYGEKAPDDSVSATLGDFYFEYGDCDVHTYTENGWKRVFNMKGDNGKSGINGKDGLSWLSGEGKPDSSDGRNGDYWMNTKTLTVYQKENGKWHYKTRIADGVRYDYANDSDGEIKILCIGNSYSKDTIYHVPEIFHDLGIHNFELGHLYIANCSVQRHYANLTENPNITEQGVQRYQYRLHNGEKWITKSNDNFPSKDAVLSDNWDFIVIQHKSSGILNEADGDVEYYGKLVNEVRKYCPDATIVWNMTWANSEEKTGHKQMEKYESIIANTQAYYSADGQVSFSNPIGTAIQNARSSHLGDTMNRDGAHLNYSIGCYTAGLTFVGSITGIDITDATWRPSGEESAISEEEQKIAIESADNALKTPFAVTRSKYQ